MSDTLVLDQSYFPLGRVPWKRSLALLRKGKAEVIINYEDWSIKTITIEIPIPSVIRLIEKIVGRRKGIKFSRQNIYFRDKGACQYCNKKVPMPDMTLDHVIPRALGGTTTWENVVVSCMSCNQKKSNKSLQKSGMRLLSVPVKPKKVPDVMRFTFMWRPGMPDAWKQFLASYSYWNSELQE